MAKKLLSILLTAVMLFSTAILIPASAASFVRGDVNADGQISSADARLALRGAVGLEKLTADFIMRSDADKSGKVEPSDARRILRASVGLDVIEQDNHDHQVDVWKPVTAEDGTYAPYHTGVCTVCGAPVFGDHDDGVSVIQASTCTEPGSGIEKCSLCGAEGAAVTLPPEHDWQEVEGTRKEATCTEDGSVEMKCAVCGKTKTEKEPKGHVPGTPATCLQAQVCTRCGEVIAPALGHSFKEGAAISATKGLRCERCGVTAVPGFNDLVNVLKDGSHRFTGVYISEATSQEPKTEGMMSTIFKMLESLAKKEGETLDIESMLGEINFAESENDYYKNQVLTDYSFNLYGQNVVSALKENDAASVTTERITGVDFLRSLPDTLTTGTTSEGKSSGRQIDLTPYKNTQLGDVLKVTVTMNPEQHSEVVANGGDSPISRIDSVFAEVETAMEEINLESEGLTAEGSEEDDGFVSLLLSALEFNSDCLCNSVVTFYFDAATNAPIAAHYDDTINIQMIVDLYLDNDTGERTSTKTGSLEIAIDNKMDFYYFFDDWFPV